MAAPSFSPWQVCPFPQMQESTKGLLAPPQEAAGISPYPSLPFVTDGYLPAPQSAALQQQLLQQQQQLQQQQLLQASALSAGRMTEAAPQVWGDPQGASALQALGAPRCIAVGEYLHGSQDPGAPLGSPQLAASHFGSSFLPPQSFSVENSHGPPGGPVARPSLTSNPSSLERSSGLYGSSVSASGFPFYYGHASFPFLPGSAIGCLGQQGTLAPAPAGSSMPPQFAMQGLQESPNPDCNRLTAELGSTVASMRELVADSPCGRPNGLLQLAAALDTRVECALTSFKKLDELMSEQLLTVNQHMHLLSAADEFQSKVVELHRLMRDIDPQYNKMLNAKEAQGVRSYMQALEKKYFAKEQCSSIDQKYNSEQKHNNYQKWNNDKENANKYNSDDNEMIFKYNHGRNENILKYSNGNNENAHKYNNEGNESAHYNVEDKENVSAAVPQNCTSSNSNSIGLSRRRSVRQYKRLHTASLHRGPHQRLVPHGIKTEPMSVCP